MRNILRHIEQSLSMLGLTLPSLISLSFSEMLLKIPSLAVV